MTGRAAHARPAEIDTSSRTAATVLRWTGMLGIATIATVRCMVVFAPQVWFDVDPAQVPDPLAALGPAGSLGLDVLLLLACACGLLGEALAKRGVDGVLLALALIPAVALILHGRGDAQDLWRGATWLAGAIACVTAAHLARDRTLRLLLTALLLAVIAPLLVRGLVQVTVEHAQNVAAFETSKEQYFAQRGWTPGSAAALIYERRLRQANPTGWFTTTNIYASVMAVGLVAGVGLALAALRSRRGAGWLAAAALAAALAGAGLWWCDSRGGLLAAAAGLALLGVPWLAPNAGAVLRRYARPVLAALLGAVLLGVAVRGVMLPEGFAGEKSLLFRWHYFIGAGRMMAEHPLLGVGPDGFQAAYALHRPPRSPEEVTSAHSVFVDWLAMLGLVGGAWVVLVLMITGRDLGPAEDSVADGDDLAPARAGKAPSPPHFVRAPGFTACGVAAVAFTGALAVEWHVLDVTGASARLVGAAAYVLVAAGLALLMDRLDGWRVRWAIFAAVAALLVHGQIEMTFATPGAAVWALALAGVAGGVRGRGGWRTALGAAAVVVALALGLAVTAWIPGTRQQGLIDQAARALSPPADNAPAQALQRDMASRLLFEAYEAWPPNRAPLADAARQALIAAVTDAGADGADRLGRAPALADRLVAAEDTASTRALRAGILRILARRSDRAADWDRAIADAQRLAELDPHAIVSWRRLGNYLWEAGRRGEAVTAYRRALANSGNFELDPLKQMPLRDRALIESRLREAGGV